MGFVDTFKQCGFNQEQLMLRTITKQGKLGLKSVVQSRADYNGVCTLAVKTTVNCG